MSKQLTPFQREIEKHLIEFKEKQQYLASPKENDRIYYPDISDGLYPPIKHAFLQYAYDNSIPYHDYANHVRSSQIFGVNLFFPLLKNEKDILISFFGSLIKKELDSLYRFEYEYSPEEDWLGEWRGKEKPFEYVTAADCALFFRGRDKKNYAFLVEFKLSEKNFTPCNGYESSGNKSKNVCEDVNLLFSDYNKCYLQTYNPHKSPRKYFNKFGDPKIAFPNYELRKEKDCPFKTNNQCIRNHSFAKALIENKIVDSAYFCLIHHDENNDIIKEWHDYYNLLSSTLQDELRIIKASYIVKKSKDELYKKYFHDRYKIY